MDTICAFPKTLKGYVATRSKGNRTMSFDLTLMCFRNGESATFKRSLVEEIVATGAVNPTFPLTSVEYRDGGGDIYGANRGDDIDHLMFNHFGGDTFMQRIWELADRTGSFFVWPDVGRSVAVTRAETMKHIHADIENDHKPPFIVRSGNELADAISFQKDPEGPTPGKR
jgi:hypothetical protein